MMKFWVICGQEWKVCHAFCVSLFFSFLIFVLPIFPVFLWTKISFVFTLLLLSCKELLRYLLWLYIMSKFVLQGSFSLSVDDTRLLLTTVNGGKKKNHSFKIRTPWLRFSNMFQPCRCSCWEGCKQSHKHAELWRSIVCWMLNHTRFPPLDSGM